MSQRIIFAGTPVFSTTALAALITAGYEVVGVYTQPDRPKGRGKKLAKSPVKELAERHRIPVFQPLSLKGIEAQQIFAALKPDLMIVVAYGLLLPKEILTIPKFGCINIHASLLPRWRGAAPIQRAIESGDAESGVCIMQMDEGLDTGPVWLKGSVPLVNHMTSGELHDGLQALGADLLLKALPIIIAGNTQPTIQEVQGINYAHKINKSEALIDWSLPALTIVRKIHAFNPAPGAFSYLAGGLIKFWCCRLTEEQSSRAPGTLVVANDALYVVAGDGVLIELLMLQMAGKKALEAALFIKGNNVHHKELGNA